MTEPLTIACIIPTYNGRQELERLLDSLARQRIEFDTFIVDSSSRDGTFERAQARCPNVLRIDSKDFNHGGTRQMMVERHPDYAVCVFLTQDAYLEDPDALAAIVRPFSDPTVGAVCGRQSRAASACLRDRDVVPDGVRRDRGFPDGCSVRLLGVGCCTDAVCVSAPRETPCQQTTCCN